MAVRVEQRTHVLFVVITNTQGIRLARIPTATSWGLRVSTDPSKALNGQEEVVHQSGTLGRSIVAKVPVVEPGTNRVLGMVSVGISTKEFDEQFSKNLRVLAPWAAQRC